MATGRRRAKPAPQGKQIRQHQLPFSADANPARRAPPICVCTLAGAFRRLSICCFHPKLNLWPHRRAAAGALGEGPGDDPDCDLAHYCDLAHLTSGRRDVGMHVVRAIEVNRPYLKCATMVGAVHLNRLGRLGQSLLPR